MKENRMSKFEELCKAANASIVAELHQQQRCYNFAGDLAKGLVEYLECPAARAEHILLKEGEISKPARFVEEATYVDGEG